LVAGNLFPFFINENDIQYQIKYHHQ